MFTEATTITADAESGILARLRRGDEAAYETLVREHGSRLLGTARRYLPGEADAQDAVQDTFLAVFRSIDSFGGNAKLSTWLHRILVNCCLMKLRSRRRHPEDSTADLGTADGEAWDWSEPEALWSTSVESSVHGAEVSAALRACIARLPEHYRMILQLRVVEELETEQVAERLNITGNAVKIRLHRARQALRTLLTAQLDDAATATTSPSPAGIGAQAGWRSARVAVDRRGTRDIAARRPRSRRGALVA